MSKKGSGKDKLQPGAPKPPDAGKDDLGTQGKAKK